MQTRLILILVLAFILFLLTFERTEKIAKNVTTTPSKTEKYCLRDEDCVPAQCCHPTDCVNKNFKPNCKGIVCTMECRPGTMDCGQGYCACVDNECRAIIR